MEFDLSLMDCACYCTSCAAITKQCIVLLAVILYGWNTLHPRYNALQYNADSAITRLRSWTPIFQVGLVSG